MEQEVATGLDWLKKPTKPFSPAFSGVVKDSSLRLLRKTVLLGVEVVYGTACRGDGEGDDSGVDVGDDGGDSNCGEESDSS
mmetsp:Transcript_41129/g.80682  ORF Transcript_41129/g.80682 Transcript_41129/m.80682 type:complete len:81 (+) Transcript_41129:1196-1438(+)